MPLELQIIVDDKGTAKVTKFTDTTSKKMKGVETQSVSTFKKMDQGVRKASKSIKSLLLPALAAIGVGGYMVKLASDVEETGNKFNVVFGNMSNQTREWANTFGDMVGRATSDVEVWLSTLQDTFVPLGYTREGAAELSKALVQLSTDVASFQNASNREVIDSFTSAIVGNHESVRKYGIVITEATLKQEALSSGIINTNRELTQQEKIQARINLIFKGSTDAYGDAIETQDSFANQVRRLTSEVKELAISLGQILIPPLLSFIRFLNDIMPQVKLFTQFAFADMSETAQTTGITIKQLSGTVKKAFDDIIDKPKDFKEALTSIFFPGMQLVKIIEDASGAMAIELLPAAAAVQSQMEGNEDAFNKAVKALSEMDKTLDLTEESYQDLLKTLQGIKAEGGLAGESDKNRKKELDDLEEWRALKADTLFKSVEDAKAARYAEFSAERDVLAQRQEAEDEFEAWRLGKHQEFLDQKADLEFRDLELVEFIERSKQQLYEQGVNAFTDVMGGLLGKSKGAAYVQTIWSTYSAAQKAYESQLNPLDPTSLGRAVAAAAFSVLQGLGRAAAISKQGYALGTDHVTTGTESFMAGERGLLERVQVTPLTSYNYGGAQTNNRNINMVLNFDSFDESFIRDKFLPMMKNVMVKDGISL